MQLRERLRLAREELRQALTEWRPPARPKLLPVPPLLAASCLRWALGRADHSLAYRAAATLNLCDPDLMWRHLVRFAAEEVACHSPARLFETLALRGDRRSRSGDAWPVTSLLIARLIAAGTQIGPLALAALCGDPDADCPCLCPLIERGRALLAPRTRFAALDRLAEDGAGWDRLDAGEAAVRITGSKAALLACLFNAEAAEGAATEEGRVEIPLAALTHETPEGLAALRTALDQDLDLREVIQSSSPPSVEAAQAFGALLVRLEWWGTGARTALAECALRAAAPPLDGRHVDSMIRLLSCGKRAVIDGFRRTYFPTLEL